MRKQTQLITALDMDTRQEALDIVSRAEGCTWFKVGSQLFARCGPEIVRDVQGFGKHIFLDLKFHDIPNTVAKVAAAAAALKVDLLTLHALGGRNMIAAAREAVKDVDTRILAVTVLTSLDDHMLRTEVGLHETSGSAVARLAALAVDAGAHGIVCSPHEIAVVRDKVGAEALIVTPGVRPSWAATDDQARVMSPREAAQAGADFVVVGRPILRHERPAEAVRLVLEELTL
jgi:orotidine-5'-phosphate decarboxylase